jgi:glycosyltransferase involved in cell wall biosynthesis
MAARWPCQLTHRFRRRLLNISLMKINVASFAYFGRFLAKEMDRLGHLGRLFTNLPVSRAGVSPQHLLSQPLLVGPYYLAGKLRLHRVERLLNWPTIDVFDRWVAAHMTPCDVFHCFSGFGRRAHQVARQQHGAMTIVERGSTHIAYQDSLLREEYERWGVPYHGIDPRQIDKELQEYEECDHITVQSTFAWRSFVERGVAATKLIKLPLGVDLEMFRRIPKQDSTFRVLYAGTMSLRKGIPYLLEAVGSLRLPNFEFVVNGTISAEVRHIVKRYADKIRFLGTRPFNQLCHVYSQASVLVLPTIEDGFAKVITEGMACGVPVIATTNCSAEDVFNDGVEGFVIPIRNVEAIRERILLLYEDSTMRLKMAEAAFERSRLSGGWRSYGELAYEVYSRKLSSHRGQRPASYTGA